MPAGAPRYKAPCAWQASSTTARPCLRHNERRAVHIGALAEKMHGNDRFGAFCYSALDFANVQIECSFINIDEYRLCARAGHHKRGCDERKNRHDDFIPGPDPQRFQA